MNSDTENLQTWRIWDENLYLLVVACTGDGAGGTNICGPDAAAMLDACRSCRGHADADKLAHETSPQHVINLTWSRYR